MKPTTTTTAIASMVGSLHRSLNGGALLSYDEDNEKEKLLLMNDNERNNDHPKEQINKVQDISDYPGHRRRVETVDNRLLKRQMNRPPSGHVFMKTGGNALQAVPEQLLEDMRGNNGCVRVIIPNNVLPGQLLYVSTPDQRVVSITIPSGYYPGHVLLVDTSIEKNQKVNEVMVERAINGPTKTMTVIRGHDIDATDLFLVEPFDKNDS